MNEYLAAILLGIVEGLTEFLPVSSTAHLRIVQSLIGQDPEDAYWKMFAVVIQLGAILAVVVSFRRRLIEFLLSFPKGNQEKNPKGDSNQEGARKNELGTGKWWRHPLSLVSISFFITAGPCFLIDKIIDDHLENFFVIGLALLVGGVAMWLIDTLCEGRAKTKELENMSLGQAVFIGLTQILAAAFPGTSRSMSTIAGGQLVGLDRPTALEFSFFLSIPVMLAASLFKLLQYVLKGENSMDSHQIQVLAIGFGVSFLVAWGAITWLMHWVRKHGFVPFAIYRILAGIAVLTLLRWK